MTADFDCIPRSTADFHLPPRLVEHKVSALFARGDRCRPGTKFYFRSTLCGYDLCPCCYRTPQWVGADAGAVWFDDDKGRHIPAVRMVIKAAPTTMFHTVF